MRFLSALLLTIIIGATALTVAQAQRKNKKLNRKPSAVKQEPMSKKNSAPNEFKVLFETDQSAVEEPFIFVARTEKQYAQLKTLTPDLPAFETIDWTQTAIVAVFAGQKPTPGFQINFEKTTSKNIDKTFVSLKISLDSPPKDVMLAQVLTAPAKIVSIPVDEAGGISIVPDVNWRLKMQTFSVSESQFESSGGMVGAIRRSSVSGSIDVLQTGNFITAFFNIGTGGNAPRGIYDTATGTIENNSIVLPRVDAGNLIENPHPPLKATGKISEKSLSLSFDSLPTYVSDGFSGRGNLTGLLIK